MRLNPAKVVLPGAINGRALWLRPSLGAAIQLEAQYGLNKLSRGLSEGSLSIVHAILGNHDAPSDAIFSFDDCRRKHGMRDAIDMYANALLVYVAGCYGIDLEAPADASASAPEANIGETLEKLFEIGTGWLGWSPSETYAATPVEIIAAQRGLVAKLKAVHGAADHDEAETTIPEAPSEAEVQRNLARLRAMMQGGENRAVG